MAKTIPNDEKVFMVSKSTNTIYSGSAALKAMNDWYTMEDVSNTVRPYKVFTALLNQSGEGAEESINGEDAFNKGVTYLITANPNNEDLTLCGAPNNNVGTYFICNSDVAPSTFSINVTLQYNTGAPVATVLENTIGNIWFTYDYLGVYEIHSSGLFSNNKTIISNTPEQYIESPTDLYNYSGYPNGDSAVYLFSYANLSPFNGLFGGFAQNAIEIRVYN